MTEIWNEVDLKIPPLITIKVSDVTFAKQVRSIFLKRKTSEFDYLQDEIANTAALLSRLMARRKNSFHNMSGFKSVCKLNSALSRLLKLAVEKSLNNFFQMLPDSTSYNEVPSRNSFDYILIRLISVHKIFQRISYCCLESAQYFNKLMKKNFFMDTIALFLATIAKLWDLTNKLGNTYSEFYRKLLQFRKCFPQMDSHSSFENVVFPRELEKFTMQQQPTSTEKEVSNTTESTSTITMHKELPQAPSVPVVSVLPKLQKEEDLGMAISRESLKPVIDLSRIHNVDDVRAFFKKEDEKRKKSMNSCATKYILKHEWLAIQKLVERKVIANDHQKALSVFRKFITSKT
ncbi:uncharacterized protein LOC129910463 [Episyrphus balteatus]|uniref:uncharacterized protein LOC129910463 n=1 Tax=Episyrphus balteatus TaxID=286459 RepID=UPI0024858403|nr:uncharacterized protein LOC129910463 [Episyrphus balteatus]